MVPSDHPPLALRLPQAARLLNVSTRTLWEWAKSGRVPVCRVGTGRRRVLLFPTAELQAWLSRQAETEKGGQQ
jgi:excisionase family DNA binding protein